MKKVLVVGVPDLGKGEICQMISKGLAKTEEIHVIGSVEEELEGMGRRLGKFATYNEYLLSYALYQRQIDKTIFTDRKGIVVSGGIISIWAHLAIAHDESLAHPGSPQIGIRLDQALQTVGLLMYDTIDVFSHIIFIEEKIAEIPEPLNQRERMQVHIRSALDWLETKYLVIPPEGSLEEKTELALGFIREYSKEDSDNVDGDSSNKGGANRASS